jgi:hypothetical protein
MLMSMLCDAIGARGSSEVCVRRGRGHLHKARGKDAWFYANVSKAKKVGGDVTTTLFRRWVG